MFDLSPRKSLWNDGPAFELHLSPDGAPAVALRSICSGGGGSQQSTSMQQSKSSNEPPEFLQPYLKSAIGDLSGYYNANKEAPDFFPGSTVAPQSDATLQALKMLQERGRAGSPVTGAAGGALTDTLTGKYLDPTTNPQFQRALEASHQPYVDTFMGQVLPGINSAFVGSGRAGSGQHQASVDRAVTGLNRTISDADAKAGSDYFTGERGRMLSAAGLAPTIAAADYADIGAIGQAGEARDAYTQAGINENVARYNYENNKQMDWVNKYLQILNGGYPGGVTNSTSTGTQSASTSTSPWGSIMGGVGLALQAAPLFGFSDERLKEDISEPIGTTFDGLPLRRWRYKGDPTPHIGFVAQELAELRPDAVAEHSSGYLMVDHRAATEHRGLF